MKNKLFPVQLFLSTSFLFAATATIAQSEKELFIVPYAEIGTSSYELAFGVTQEGRRSENRFNFDFMMIKFGVAASWGDFYANAYYRTTDDDSDIQTFQDLDGPSFVPIPIKWTADREESSLAIGYKLTPEIAIFAGYRTSTWEGSTPTIYIFDNDVPLDSNATFDHDGLFLGGSYTLSLSESGALTFSLGYAWLDTEIKEVFLGNPFAFGSGDGSGIKFGATWRDYFNQDWGYTVAVEHFDYEYDITPNQALELDIEERETTLSLGLFYVF